MMSPKATTLVIALSFFRVGLAVYNENPCKAKDGECKYYWQCPNGDYVSRECPSQSANVKCCVYAQNESPCKNDGISECLNTNYKSCSGGSFVSGLCPTQPGDVKCCKRSSGGSSVSGGPLNIISREEWGAEPPKSRFSSMSPAVQYVFVHHEGSNSAGCFSKDKCIEKMKIIQNVHQK